MLKYADVSKDTTLKELGSNDMGLSEEEALKRVKIFGQNAIADKKRKSVLGLFFCQFGDVMTILLIAAAAVSGLIAYLSSDISDLVDTVIIICIIFLNALVGTVQQYRADKAIEGLKKLNSPSARVMRGGRVVSIATSALTVGDIVLLEEGDVIPADMRLLSATSLFVDESALTGESQSVEKRDTVVEGNVTYENAGNLLFSSTFVVKGKGTGVVTAVGKDTEIGKIAEMLEGVKEGETPLERSLNKLGKFISAFVIVIAAVIFAVGYFAQGTGLLKNFMTAVAIAVAAIPEGLPAVVSVIMAMGVQRMSQKSVVIRKMKCVETLGGCTCICTDKTGTLTQNRMKVVQVSCKGRDEDMLLKCMSVCNGVKGERGSYIGDPTEIAIKTYAVSRGYGGEFTVKDEIPFTSERKLMSVLAEENGRQFVFTKGAPEEVLKRCAGGVDKDAVISECEKMSESALRVLAFAYRQGGGFSEDNLTFLGICGMRDGLKDGVKEAVLACKSAGIETVMITGDSVKTAYAIAERAGICDDISQVYTGEQLDGMNKPRLNEAIKRGRVFARVSPRHKNIIVNVKRAQGEVVAMTGDGVNDAPPVKSADIGIVMGRSGTEVTKSVADMVIADDNFTTIVGAVREGRRISSNIKKTIRFFLSTNLAEVLAIVLVTFIFLGKEFLPSTQLLWINLITDSFPVLALGVEKGDADDMRHTPERAEKSLFSPQSICSVIVFSLYITGVTVCAYAFALGKYGNAVATTTAFLILSFSELFHVFNIRSGNRSAFYKPFSNKVLLLTVAAGLAVNLALCFSPLAAAFSIARLPASMWLAVAGLSLSVIAFGEIYKLIVYAIKRERSKKLSK